MSKRRQQESKRKEKQQDFHKRQIEQRLFNQKTVKYARITPTNIDSLKNESIEVIDSVLNAQRTKRTLPPPLNRAFLPLARSNWIGPPDRFTGSFAVEAKWTLARLGVHHVKLNSLLAHRRLFSKQIILNELDNAAATLTTCIAHFGVSTWSLEMELLLAECRGGFEANRELLSRILERPLHPNERLLAEFSSQRVDDTLSTNQYNRAIGAFLSRGRYEKTDGPLFFLLRFSLLPTYAQSGLIPTAYAAYLLHSYSTRPLIDHYLATIRLLRHAYCNGYDSTIEVLQGGEQLARITEKELDTLLLCGFDKSRPHYSKELSMAHNLYSSGQFKELISLAAQELPRDPLHFAWYEFLASATILDGSALPDCLPPDSKAKALLEATRRVLEYNEDIDATTLSMLKASTALEGTPLGYQITGFCYRIARPNVFSRRLVEVIYHQSVPPTCIAFLPERLRIRLLKDVKLRSTPEVAELAQRLCDRLSSADDNPLFNSVEPTLRQLLIAELEHFVGHPEQALPRYVQLLQSAVLPAERAAEAVRGAFACQLLLGQFNDAANLVASTSLPPIVLFCLVDLDSAADAYTSQPEAVDRSSIGWPILFMLKYKLGNTSLEDVFTAYANFIESTGVTRPSKLGHTGVERFGRPQFLFFLRWICHQDLLDSDLEYSGTTDVENERVAILQLLQELDPEHLVAYANEISQLQQQLAVRKAMRHVVKSKIHFNTEGIEKSLGVSYSEVFERYCAMTRLTEGARKSVDLQWDSLAGKDLIVEAPDLLFRELFHALRFAFLWSNEYGLDSYLSVHIRHQTIKGALRSMFERAHLVTETEKGIYATNETWPSELSALDDDKQHRVQKALRTFSHAIDTIIGAVSNTWMRIRGAPDGRNGLFIIDFLDSEVDDFRKQLVNVESMFDFNDFIFARIRERLGLCLISIRTKFRLDLRSWLEGSLQILQDTIAEISDELPSVQTAITYCRTEIQNGIDEICEWFHIQDAGQIEDFSINTLVIASIDNIAKCFPSSTFRCEVDCEDQIRLRGKCFIPLWYAFFQVFENVVTYSGEGSLHTKLTIACNEEFLIFTFTNPLGDDQVEEEVRSALEEKRKYRPEMIRQERGSGFHKLRKLIRTDLGNEDNSVDVSVDARIFTTRCQIKRNGLTV